MAKQKGIHQLKGKVGGMSYYQQSGVTDGLVRRIPEGLSGRVKTGDEYANTRLNNEEFKNANAMATFAFRAVPNRKASMMRRFAIAEMTKSALEFVKGGTGQWGQRIPTETFDNIIVDMLERHSKSGPYAGEYGAISSNISAQNVVTVTLQPDEATIQALVDKGINGFYVLFVKGAMCELVDNDGFVRQYFGISSITPHDYIVDLDDVIGMDLDFTPSYQTLGFSPSGYATLIQTPNQGMFSILSFIPYRTIGSSRHTLYEYATFTAVALGEVPGN